IREGEEKAKRKEMERLKLEEEQRLGKTRAKFWAEREIKETEKEKLVKENLKERLSEIQKREEAERKKFLERVQGEKKEIKEALKIEEPSVPFQPTEIFRPLPQKPSLREKFWARFIIFFVILAVLAAIFTFWYWFLYIRKPPLPPSPPSPPPEIIIVPEIAIPETLISVEAIRTFEITKSEETLIHLSQILKEDLGEGQLTRIIIKDLTKKKVPGLKEFFDTFQVKTPEDFYSKLLETDEFTLFIYSQKEGNRLGLVTKIETKEGLPEILRFWEDTMETDSASFFTFLGKEKPALIDYFIRTTYQQRVIRCQTFTEEDFGACYLITDNYFIFTSSLESMKKTIDRLP
ncbi:hypothetical protein MUP06_02510, partial [Patescibacteria group bacterium]|nr:hypothetical protein [Patescibacteria group bacterium]